MAVRTLFLLALAAHICTVSYADDSEPAEPVCGDNEILDDCPANSPADYCPKSANDNKECPAPDPCPAPACKCAFNFKRADNGTCIPTTECPPFPCYGCNEEYVACPPICPSDDCSLPRVTGICPFRIGIILECNPQCQCKDGYGRYNGRCIPFAECPDLCPENEEYNSCLQNVCRAIDCSNRNDPVECGCVRPDSCERGCVCKDSYYKNSTGSCVTSDECDDGC